MTSTERGVALLGRVVGFLEYYMGVFALVTLTMTVALGIITTERVFLSIAGRVRSQLAHKAFGILGMTFLITHIALMIGLGHVPPAAAVVPVAGLYKGLGLLAFDLMMVAVATGMMRGRFAVKAKPWVWRVLHSTAYIAWPVAILHGMAAGRQTLGEWVNWSYVACLAAVGAALVVRVLASMRRPPAVTEKVRGPEVTAPIPVVVPNERPQTVGAANRAAAAAAAASAAAAQNAAFNAAENTPVSLAEARRRYREAG
ncbi:hypothetical protein [Nonomuraea sp. SYSU D8015]|uniref:hypothetical protein n=1 Tax=Nonomuraea sp. SYSU D8015 TaxID=2593644 RepID=UPI0016615B3F|nr:hypothetical protein [Nonomuraea sp. SYSU D8015]